jgi:membrane protein implicated in regulation of membrane protease activity
MVGFYLVLLFLGLAIFALAIFGNIDHDLSIGDHDLGGGHDFHGDHDTDGNATPGLFSVRTISALFAGFGVAGLVAKLLLGWGIGGQLLLGFGTGIFLAGVAYLIMLGFYSQQAGGVRDAATFSGKTALVTTATGTQGIGECSIDNFHYTFREVANNKVYLNEIVKVVSSQDGLLIVEKI